MEKKKCIGTDIVNVLNYIEEVWGGKSKRINVLLYSDMGDTKKEVTLSKRFSPNLKFYVLYYLVPGSPQATFIRKKYWIKYFRERKADVKFFFPEEVHNEQTFKELLGNRGEKEEWF
jgi:hypothetical protein